ncbi:MAG: SDR family NAD(P)-dependent oxidoreductase [Geminicoccaceae bacterium]
MLIAVTGGTGFVGRHVVETLRRAGYEVRALSRREAPDLVAMGASVVRGDIQHGDGVDRLIDGADAVVHAAGVLQAPDRGAFAAVNADGTARVADAMAARPGSVLVQVSSLAARLPTISPYAASKALGEQVALERADRLRVVVVRPPAVYGPGDRSTLPIFQGLNRGWLPHPAGKAAKFSLLYASELAQLIVALLAQPPASGTIVEPDDGTVGGYGWADLAAIAQQRTGRRVRAVGLPKLPLAIAARLAEGYAARRGHVPLLARGKVDEFFHRDWVCDASRLHAVSAWRPHIRFGDGLTTTLAWYRSAGWL